MTACGSYEKCSECTHLGLCENGYSTETGEDLEYDPDLWQIYNGELIEQEWMDSLSQVR